ncbi:hypothetical protein LXM59_12225 [Pseudomonas nitroreducens]|uniref:hypothetical protein n=1 Tax=Pseudomonas TaxID=286 RepID=UPI000AEF0924|nr:MULTISPECIES: hypothetical protein [Pseudomonas]MCE4069588.1 hypothetical protein [Pseudomonas nitritireducens]MCE4079249.1 hypothetical protein [Pseudomonas nitroreducens]
MGFPLDEGRPALGAGLVMSQRYCVLAQFVRRQAQWQESSVGHETWYAGAKNLHFDSSRWSTVKEFRERMMTTGASDFPYRFHPRQFLTIRRHCCCKQFFPMEIFAKCLS